MNTSNEDSLIDKTNWNNSGDPFDPIDKYCWNNVILQPSLGVRIGRTILDKQIKKFAIRNNSIRLSRDFTYPLELELFDLAGKILFNADIFEYEKVIPLGLNVENKVMIMKIDSKNMREYFKVGY
jgi:hypothetical protein